MSCACKAFSRATRIRIRCSIRRRIALDGKGFVQTGAIEARPDVRPNDAAAARLSLQTSFVGIFAVGDVRSGSVKRVGAAIGEGAAVVAQLHAYLAATRTESAEARAHEAAGARLIARN